MKFKYSCKIALCVDLLLLLLSPTTSISGTGNLGYSNLNIKLAHKTEERSLAEATDSEHEAFDPIIGKSSQDPSSSRRLCPIGHFQCKVNYLMCIPQKNNCDGKPDCPDGGSDEENCLDPHVKSEWDFTFIKRPDEDAEKQNGTCWYFPLNHHAFDSDNSMEYVLLEGISTTSAPINAKTTKLVSPFEIRRTGVEIGQRTHDFPKGNYYKRQQRNILAEKTNFESASSVPDESGINEIESFWQTEGCLCASEKLFCQNLQLDNLRFLPTHVEFLDLSGSRVDNMDFTSPAFPNLQTLVLSGCYVEDIVPGAFSQLHSLQVLYLTNNRLRYIPENVFSAGGESNSIKRLYLDYNQISVLQPESFDGLSSLIELNLRHNLLTGREIDIFKPLKSLLILHLNSNQIESIRSKFFRGLSNLRTLTLTNNMISYIETGTFENLISLQQLYLNWNKLQVLEDSGFCNLRNLLTLNLRGNEISHIQTNAFDCLESLTSLNMEKNKLGDFTQATRIFENLTALEYIYFDQFWMCSWAHFVRSCEPKGDGISSVKNLLDNIVLRVCVIAFGVVSIFGNLFVIFCRIIVREPNRVHSFYIRNLAAADLLMGFFLLSIAWHDLSYRGEFLTYQYAWRHSLTCQLSGLLSTWSSECSVLILTLITLDRYVSIVQPFKEKTTSLNVAFGICIFLWIISFFLSYMPLSGLFNNYFDGTFYTGNGLCLPLHIHNPWASAWEYSFVLFVILNSAAFIFICFAYIRMLNVIKRSTLTIRSTQQKQDSLLAKRFALVVLTDFLCWAPIVIAKVVAMAGVSIPSDLYAWLAVFALPVNSALNPIIYTLTTKLFKQQIVKMSRSLRSRLMRRAGHSEDSSVSLSLFRYRTPRTANTSLTHSVKQKRDKIGTDSVKTTRSTIQLKMLVPSSHSNAHGTAITIEPENKSPGEDSCCDTEKFDSKYISHVSQTHSEVTSEI